MKCGITKGGDFLSSTVVDDATSPCIGSLVAVQGLVALVASSIKTLQARIEPDISTSYEGVQ